MRSLELAVKYLAGDRIIGTAAERAAMTSYDVGVWKEIGRASAQNNSTVNIPCALDPVCPYLMILTCHTPYEQTNTDPALRFNTDTGTNYVRRRSQNHAAYDTANQAGLVYHGGTSQCPEFDVAFVTNTSASQEKMAVMHGFNGKGNNSSDAGVSSETYGKWTNTSDLISTVNLYNVQGGTPLFKSGSEIVVLGFDPDDTTGAVSKWVKLKEVTLPSDGDTLETGTSGWTSKKYMLMEAHIERADGNSITPHLRFNGDTGSNYTRIRSGDGGSAAHNTGQSTIDFSEGENSLNQYYTYWMCNVSAEAKLCIGHTTGDDTGTTSPSRKEIMGKWNDTSELIDNIHIFNNGGAGSFKAGSKITVWGFD